MALALLIKLSIVKAQVELIQLTSPTALAILLVMLTLDNLSCMTRKPTQLLTLLLVV
jgi:hypothetical protein